MQMYKENASLQNHYPLKNKIKWITHARNARGSVFDTNIYNYICLLYA